ncbi:hypothetical protein [Mycobacterium kubicae]|uniref:hypothetical protein n=1 Tax=Mycobacterium kubicae TaxID=120959 RepID=UPI0013F4D110|nr:hypothetical protein [Mycobacterium kubicae]
MIIADYYTHFLGRSHIAAAPNMATSLARGGKDSSAIADIAKRMLTGTVESPRPPACCAKPPVPGM